MHGLKQQIFPPCEKGKSNSGHAIAHLFKLTMCHNLSATLGLNDFTLAVGEKSKQSVYNIPLQTYTPSQCENKVRLNTDVVDNHSVAPALTAGHQYLAGILTSGMCGNEEIVENAESDNK